jgi:hypothetical protein
VHDDTAILHESIEFRLRRTPSDAADTQAANITSRIQDESLGVRRYRAVWAARLGGGSLLVDSQGA